MPTDIADGNAEAPARQGDEIEIIAARCIRRKRTSSNIKTSHLGRSYAVISLLHSARHGHLKCLFLDLSLLSYVFDDGNKMGDPPFRVFYRRDRLLGQEHLATPFSVSEYLAERLP